MSENYRKSIASLNKFPQFTTMNVIDGQAGLISYTSLIFYSLTIDNILNTIVLLILAGVTIATLTGDNGILTQASKAKDKSTEAEAIERVKVEVAGSYGTDGKISIDQLNKNLKNINGLSYNGSELSDSNKIANLPATVTLNGYDILIHANGNVSIGDTLENAINNQKTYNENTKLVDEYGNIMVIPAGFKIASDSATDVTGGVVIEDATYDGTMASQFVWIPVGTIYTNAEKTESKIINLNRYTFASDGTPTPQGTNVINSYYQELTTSSYGNAVAKDIEKFKTTANNNHGYYIGRYEAGVTGYDSVTTSNSNSETNWTGYTGDNTQLVCKSGQQVWNYVTQNKASELSKNMYNNTLPFTSDLINSYAWDTAIVFIQTFGTESNSITYSYQIGLSTTTSQPSTTGTGILSSTKKVDKQCNIFDMTGSCREWTTETSSKDNNPCAIRGGVCGSNEGYTSVRFNGYIISLADKYKSFRPLLYL